MNTHALGKPVLAAACIACGLVFSGAVHAVPTVDPLVLGSAPASAGAGLAGTWYKLDNDAHFSDYVYTETDPGSSRYGQTAPIKDFSWGSGIWAATDIAALASGSSPYVTATATTQSAVSFANNIYNNTVSSGGYGTPWAPDYNRSLAPVVGGTNSCTVATSASTACANEQNYAAVFSGYIYVGSAGIYDFGVFADDGFLFDLLGANNSSLSMGHNSVVGSAGRGFYSLTEETGNVSGIELGVGYYGVNLSYFNREEAGVIDLGWRGPGNAGWTVVAPDKLYNNVPEPTSIALMGLGMLGLWGTRRRATVAKPVA